MFPNLCLTPVYWTRERNNCNKEIIKYNCIALPQFNAWNQWWNNTQKQNTKLHFVKHGGGFLNVVGLTLLLQKLPKKVILTSQSKMFNRTSLPHNSKHVWKRKILFNIDVIVNIKISIMWKYVSSLKKKKFSSYWDTQKAAHLPKLFWNRFALTILIEF